MAITAGHRKFTIKSNFCIKDTVWPDYVQVADEHLRMPAGLINTVCSIIAIAMNCLNQGRKKNVASTSPLPIITGVFK